MNLALDLQGLSSVLEISLDKWAKHSRYKKQWEKMPATTKNIPGHAFKEMPGIDPAWWDRWWAQQHNRFIRLPDVKQTNLADLHQIMYYFLTDFARGDLEIVKKPEKEPARKKKTRRR